MKDELNIWKRSREMVTEYLQRYSLKQLNNTPPGFSNNLIWNIGHIIAVQQALVYRASELPGYITNEMFQRYKPGTKPSGNATQEEADELKLLLNSLVDKTERDLQSGKFKVYHPRLTSTGFNVTTLHYALQFNNCHEGLHLGYMTNIAKFI